MRKLFIFLCFISYMLPGNAQAAPNFEKNSITVGGELTSSDTWQIDIAYHYRLSPYVGLGASVGMWKEISTDGIPKGNGWRIAKDYEMAQNLYLRPSVQIVSSSLLHIADGHLKMFVEPGWMMNIPYANVFVHLLDEHGIPKDAGRVSTNKGKWYALDCKAGFSLIFENIGISIGYRYSTLDVYGMRRNLIYDNKRFDEFYPRSKKQHSGLVSMSYSF